MDLTVHKRTFENNRRIWLVYNIHQHAQCLGHFSSGITMRVVRCTQKSRKKRSNVREPRVVPETMIFYYKILTWANDDNSDKSQSIRMYENL